MDIIKTESDFATSGDELVYQNGEEDQLAVPLHEDEVSSAEKLLQSGKKALVSL